MGIHNLIATINLNLKKKVILSYQKKSKIIIDVLNVLWDEKLINGFCFYDDNFLEIYIKSDSLGDPLIKKISFISTSGHCIYFKIKDIKKLHRSDYYIFNTIYGIQGKNRALALNAGGEALLRITL